MFLKRLLHSKNISFIRLNNPFYQFSSKSGKLDPYLILEINRNADWPTIKKSYFKLGN